MFNWSLIGLQFGSLLSRVVPLTALIFVAEKIGSILAFRLSANGSRQLKKNLQRVHPDLSPDALDMQTREGFSSYSRYWAESFKIPHLSADELAAGFTVRGYENIEKVRQEGFGPILALPHLGGWEWGAAWLHRVQGVPVCAVVERLENQAVFEWFIALRRSYGIEVIPLGEGSLPQLISSVKERKVICLLSDRDIADNGIPVDFFGEQTTLPMGPALLSLRTGAPILPTAVYFDGKQRVCEVGEPLWPKRSGPLKQNLALMTQEVAYHLEDLIRAAPDQWHVLSALWPADRE